MSGITAISASKILGADDTTPNNSTSGYVTKEQISLGLTGSPLTAQWSLSKPSISSSACQLTSDDSLATLFTPDQPGLYVISCLVDGVTTYTLSISALAISTVTAVSAIHLLPSADSQIPTPRSGVIIYFSSNSNKVSQKLNDGTVEEFLSS